MTTDARRSSARSRSIRVTPLPILSSASCCARTASSRRPKRLIAARSSANPDYGLAHYNLGVLLDLYLRRTSEALEHYEAYQASLAAPNETVARWIIDLRRRVGNADAARVAQEDGP